MPKTINPRWNRDEILLALNLYFDADRGPIASSNPKVTELSLILNKLPFRSNATDPRKYRNPNGVSMKLTHFLAIDPKHNGKGLDGYSKLDEQLFLEFEQKKSELKAICEKITSLVSKDFPGLTGSLEVEETEFVAKEGEVLYRWHSLRERDKKIIEKKKAKAIKQFGILECEVCSFDFHKAYGEFGSGFIECHHTIPLHSMENTSMTRLDDLALVCANCHRMLHRQPGITVTDLRKVHSMEKKLQ